MGEVGVLANDIKRRASLYRDAKMLGKGVEDFIELVDEIDGYAKSIREKVREYLATVGKSGV